MVETYKTLQEATNRARELNNIVKLSNGLLNTGTYDYCIKIHRENGKRFYTIVKNNDKDKKLKKEEVKGRIKEILEMRGQGLSYDKIAEEIGTYSSVIYGLHREAIKEGIYEM